MHKFRSLHTAWTRQATSVLLSKFIEIAPTGTLARCVLIGTEKDRETLPTELRSIQVLSLSGKALPDWERLFDDAGPLHVFVTFGKLAAQKREWRSPIDLFKSAFDTMLGDEYGQVLRIYGIHVLRFVRGHSWSGGDLRQLAGFSWSTWVVTPAMRSAICQAPPFFSQRS